MELRIGDRTVGDGHRTLIVAELSANHGRKKEIALQSIRAARESGADAVKLQTYTPDTMTIDCGKEPFVIRQGTIWDGRRLYELYQEAYTPWEWHAELQRAAHAEGLMFFSTPFDASSADFLEALDVPCYKIASFEITDVPLIEHVAAKKKPLIISTGIAVSGDIQEALAACRRAGNDRVALLKCTSAYPAPLEEINLRTIPDMRERFGVVTGLSDHTMGISVPVAGVALGARIVEKHFILDRGLGGPDAVFSLEPAEFAAMVKAVRDTEQALGAVSYELSPKILKSRELSRSLFAVEDIAAGELLSEDNVRCIRPAFGLPPKMKGEIMGRRARVPIERGTPLSLALIE